MPTCRNCLNVSIASKLLYKSTGHQQDLELEAHRKIKPSKTSYIFPSIQLETYSSESQATYFISFLYIKYKPHATILYQSPPFTF